jgi:hypothetical protein
MYNVEGHKLIWKSKYGPGPESFIIPEVHPSSTPVFNMPMEE